MCEDVDGAKDEQACSFGSENYQDSSSTLVVPRYPGSLPACLRQMLYNSAFLHPRHARRENCYSCPHPPPATHSARSLSTSSNGVSIGFGRSSLAKWFKRGCAALSFFSFLPRPANQPTTTTTFTHTTPGVYAYLIPAIIVSIHTHIHLRRHLSKYLHPLSDTNCIQPVLICGQLHFSMFILHVPPLILAQP